ncbi:MAG: amidohydrolase [Oscillospiraceae bacterium]|nr:amidohydrolase [Oscillospiraceae bacterium]
MNIRIKDTIIYTPDGNVTGDLCISGNRIASVGSVPDGMEFDEVIDGHNKMVVPGLINTHTHAYMSVFRNIADDLTFSDWLFGAIMPKEDRLTQEDEDAGAMLSCMEMIKSGMVAFMDMHICPGASARAAIKLGMRGVMTRGLTGQDRHDEGGLRRIREHLGECEEFAGSELIGFKFGPHAIYTCGEDYLRYLMELAREHGQGFHIHLAESLMESENCMKEHGMSPVEYLDSLGFFEIPTCAAHCVQLSEHDMDIFAERGVSVLHNPRSNLKLANGIAPVARLLLKGVNVSLGTDSQASSNDLDMFTEMGFAALLQKGINHDPVLCSAEEVVRMATVNGAKALGIDSGEIKAGKLADVVMIDLDHERFTPRNNLRSALVYSSSGTRADTVIINGEIVLRGGHLTRGDEEEIRFNAAKAAEKFA